MKGYTAADVRAAERSLLDAGAPLMRRAASGLAAVVRASAPHRILVLVGSGDNGGDALFAGADLANAGTDVRIVASSDHPHPEALDAALAAGARREPIEHARALADTSDLIVDGLVGTGSVGALRGGALAIVEALQGCATPVIAVDIPSGIDPDTGAMPSAVLPATTTVTFGAVKAGLLRDPARGIAGRIVLVDIGLDLSSATPLIVTATEPDVTLTPDPLPPS